VEYRHSDGDAGLGEGERGKRDASMKDFTAAWEGF